MNHAPDLTRLYNTLEQEGVDVFPFACAPYDALASPDGYLAMDPALIKSESQEREILVHEAGHFATDTFYQLDSPFTLRRHQENVASRWGYRRYFPLESILELMEKGCTEVWQLAEATGMPEAYVRDLLAYYQDAQGIDFAASLAQRKAAREAAEHAQAEQEDRQLFERMIAERKREKSK